MPRKFLLAAALVFACPAWALDGVSAEAGYHDDVRMWRVGVQWEWDQRWFRGGSWELGGYWDLSAGGWRSGADTVYDVGFTPVFRFETSDGGSRYLEAAIGFHQLSDLRISSGRLLSTNFQFGDHVGAGMRFGPRLRYDLGVRLQHLSNGGVRKPNPGIDFLQLRLQYHLK